MATQNYAASVQGAAIRVTRLKSDGTLLSGPMDSYTTSAFLRMSFTPEYEDGEEITEKAADGTVCVSYKAPDRLKRVTMEVAICEPDPELTALLAGGVLLSRNENTLGGTAGAAPTLTTVTQATISSTTASLYLQSNAQGLAAGDNVTVAGLTPATGSINGVQRIVTVTTSTSNVNAAGTFAATYATNTITLTLTGGTTLVKAGDYVGISGLTYTGATTGTTGPFLLVSGTVGGTVLTFTAPTGTTAIVGGSSVVVTATVATIATTNGSATGAVTVSSGSLAKRLDRSVGYAAPLIGDDPAGNGVAIEVWSYAVADGKRASQNPYFHWIFPYARLRQSGDRVIENGLLANTFEGYGIGNVGFGSGPDSRWEWNEVVDRPYAYARDDWSPSTYQLKGFNQWNATLDQNFTGAAGSYQAVNALPVADMDVTYNIPGGAQYDNTAVTDITVSDV